MPSPRIARSRLLWNAHRLCRACGIPPHERDDVVAESLLNFCAGMKNAFGRGARAVNCRYHALNGLAAALRTRRGRPLRLLADACPDPEGMLLPDLLEAVHGGMTLEGVVQLLSDVIDEEIDEDAPPNVPALLKARGQFRLPEFGTYLAGRLGLM
jgi:hypothetical protein